MTVLVYATLTDMQQAFGADELIELTDAANIPPSTLDAAKVEKAIVDASAKVNGYIGRVYRLPLTGCSDPANPGGVLPPPILTRLCCDIARYFLYDEQAPDKEVFRRYEGAEDELKAIAQGEMLLACPLGDSPGEIITVDPLNPGGQTSYSFSPRKITDALVGGYK